VDQKLPYLATIALVVLFAATLLFRLLRWLVQVARRGTPHNVERQQAIATLCQQRGMVPNPVDLATAFASVLPMVVPGELRVLGAIASKVIPGMFPVFENSFALPDGSLWASDLWTPKKSSNSFGSSDDKKQWDSYSMVSFAIPGVSLPFVGVTRKGENNTPGFARGTSLTLESIDFDERFLISAEDRRSAVMLLDQGMMQWLLDCDHVSFEITGDRGQALVKRSAESSYQPGLSPGLRLAWRSDAPHPDSRRADPVELELLFKFVDGFASRVPELVRREFAASQTPNPVLPPSI
jgi:hypothetical protein